MKNIVIGKNPVPIRIQPALDEVVNVVSSNVNTDRKFWAGIFKIKFHLVKSFMSISNIYATTARTHQKHQTFLVSTMHSMFKTLILSLSLRINFTFIIQIWIQNLWMESIFVTDYCECWFTIKYHSIIDLKHLQHNIPSQSLFIIMTVSSKSRTEHITSVFLANNFLE